MKYKYSTEVTFNIADTGPFTDFIVDGVWEYSADYITGWTDIINNEICMKVLYTNNNGVFRVDDGYYRLGSYSDGLKAVNLFNHFVIAQVIGPEIAPNPFAYFSINDFDGINEETFSRFNDTGCALDKIINTFNLRVLRLKDVYFSKFRCYNDFYNSKDFVEYSYTGVQLNEVKVDDIIDKLGIKKFPGPVFTTDLFIINDLDYDKWKELSETGSFDYGVNYKNLTMAREIANSGGKEVYVVFSNGIPVDIMIK